MFVYKYLGGMLHVQSHICSFPRKVNTFNSLMEKLTIYYYIFSQL